MRPTLAEPLAAPASARGSRVPMRPPGMYSALQLSGITFSGDPPFLALGAMIAGAPLFWSGFRHLKALRRIENTPTCKVRSLPMGSVEIVGTAEVEESLVAPLTGKQVAYYRVLVEELRSSRHGSRWVARHVEVEEPPFHLRDETGRVLVMPNGADVHLPEAYEFQDNGWSSVPAEVENFLHSRGIKKGFFRGTYRFREWHIALGEPVYVYGVAQDRPGMGREHRERVTERLREVKADPQRMRELDSDGDGRVSDLEWDSARRGALEAVDAEGTNDRVAIARGESGEMFVISNHDERELVRLLRWKAFGGVFGGGALSVGGAAYLIGRLGGL